MTDILALLDWFRKKDRAEQVDISHLKNWKLNWSPQDTDDITLKFPFRLSGCCGIKFKMKTFTNRARHSQTPAYVSDLLLQRTGIVRGSLEQFSVCGTIYGKQIKEQRVQSTPTCMINGFITLSQLELNLLHQKHLLINSKLAVVLFFSGISCLLMQMYS